MYVERVPNRKSPPAILLREAWREEGRIRKRTLANLSHWPAEKVETLRRLLQGDELVSPQDAFVITSSRPHGHVEAVLGTMRKLGIPALIASKPSRERDLVLAMVAERLVKACSKLATTRFWHTTTLAEELGVQDAQVEELYAALDWLLARQTRIEAKLAARHLKDGGYVLYDASTSYYEGKTCPLAHFGHDRDGKRLPAILYGLLADEAGRPVAVEVYPGNTGDPTTVGDRGMLTQPQIEKLRDHPGLGWISCLRSGTIRSLIDKGHLQRSLFDETNLAQIQSPDFPGERLIACFNPVLADERTRKRQDLLQATEKDLGRLSREVQRRTKKPLGKAEIGLKAGRILGRYKVGKHFLLTIEDGRFAWARHEKNIARECALDGIYIIRTSQSESALSAANAVRKYKSLATVERAFRCLKGVDLLLRPIYHRTEDHVRAHVFLCMLAYYVEWHMRQALAPLLFHDEELDVDRARRHPVAPAQPSKSARRKKNARVDDDGLPLHSFQTLLAELGTRCRNVAHLKADGAQTLQLLTQLSPVQARAFELLGL